jgi:hypothetical protein
MPAKKNFKTKILKTLNFLNCGQVKRIEFYPDPDPLVRGKDQGIRIRTKMSRIPNTACLADSLSWRKRRWYCTVRLLTKCCTRGIKGTMYREAVQDSQPRNWLASSWSGGHNSNPLCGLAWCATWRWKNPWGQVFLPYEIWSWRRSDQWN